MQTDHPLGADFFSDRPQPKPLEPELASVPTFDPGWLPSPFREHVTEAADLMQAPVDFAATDTLGTIAGATGRRALVQPKLFSQTWRAALNLWLVKIGKVGFLKSPIQDLMTAALQKIQDEWSQKQKVDLAEFEQQKKLRDLEQETWEAQWRAAKKAGTTLPPRPDPTLWEPGQRRAIVTDATMEMMHVILSQNPAGLLCKRDELIGFIADLSKQGRESERGFWLQLANGQGSFQIDRIGRGSIFVPNMCASLLGNIVPSRLKYFLPSVLAGGVEDDGFFSRMLMTWPDLSDEWQYVDRAEDRSVADAVEQVYRVLTKLSALDPLILRFSLEAQERFVEWLTDLERNVVRGSKVPAVLVAHLAKYRKFLPVIAALCELVERAVRGDLTTKVVEEEPYAALARRHIELPPEPPPPDEEVAEATLISVENLQRAINICTYYRRHAERVYSCISSPALRAGHSLATRIQQCHLGDGFTAHQVLRRGWSDLDSPELVAAAVEYLEELGWIRKVPIPTTSKGGRPSEQLKINPRIG